MASNKWNSPFAMPIYFFAAAIAAGAVALRLEPCLAQAPLSWVDAVFTATSAVCVTGLVVVDTGAHFTATGQSVILGLIQLGGLGIMTYTSLVLYLWRRRTSLMDRMAVGQNLLHDPGFHLGRFLIQVVAGVLCIEMAGALAIKLAAPGGFSFFSAWFHAVSAFCNAGFSLQADSLMAWKANPWVNLIFMALIILGGLGFSVLLETFELMTRLRQRRDPAHFRKHRLSWHARIVLATSAGLILGGAAVILAAEYMLAPGQFSLAEEFLASLFQSVTCRTAGFNTLDIGNMTNISLLVMIFLMLVGGSPGSCAGGIKTTTLRALTAFSVSRLKGRQQTVVRGFALDHETMNKALSLALFAFVIVSGATLILSVTEMGAVPHGQTRGTFLDILFEVVSAFGTVGLSTGLTAKLTTIGKVVITAVMFIGRLGPIMFLSAIREFHTEERFSWPENTLLIG